MSTTDAPAPKKALWKRPKVIVAAIAAIILLILIFQNLEPVRTEILFYTAKLPQAVLLAIVAAIAFFVGVITDGRVFRGGKKKT